MNQNNGLQKQEYEDLKSEFLDWDKLSDEALNLFLYNLEHREDEPEDRLLVESGVLPILLEKAKTKYIEEMHELSKEYDRNAIAMTQEELDKLYDGVWVEAMNKQ
jgi:hypothetical protein